MRSGMPGREPLALAFGGVVDHVPDVIFRTDGAGRWSFLSPSWSELTGLGAVASIGRHLLDIVHPREQARLASNVLSDVCRGLTTTTHQTRIRTADGEYTWIEVRARVQRDRHGRPVSSSGTITDISARKAAEEVLADETGVLELIATDRPLVEVLGATAAMVAHHTGRRTSIVEFARALDPRVRGQGRDGGAVVVTASSDGRIRSGLGARPSPHGEAIAIRPVGCRSTVGAMVVEREHAVGGDPHDVVGRALDLAAVAIRRHHRDIEIRRQALYDPLTSLPNRALLGDRMRQVIGEARRNGNLAALLLLDLDGFKDVNDMLGHDMGDRVLCEVGRRLAASLRDVDTVGRLGGDEFVVVLADVESAEAAEQVAAKLEAALRPPFEFDGVGLRVRASAGIALFPSHGDDFAVLLKRADAAMYRMKPEGGGSAVFAPEADGRRMDRVAVAAELSRAIEAGDLFLEYQPKIGLGDGRPVGVEALVRWRHPTRGVVPPRDFIELSEGTGVIKPLTDWVLTTALTDARRWWDDDPDLSLAVNLSGVILSDREMGRSIGELVSAGNLGRGRLELEVSEGALLIDPVAAIATMRHLVELGVAFAFDDFGTGYSSLSYLKRVPVEILKIDSSFVGEAVTDVRDAAIVAATVHLAHSVGITVVAEGVEDGLTRQCIEDLGCDQAQGFHIGRPMSADGLSAWLETARAGASRTEA
jgi:diguanylate cyclase (GGDEF)-like protein/PAS domain S-box-containing protein